MDESKGGTFLESAKLGPVFAMTEALRCLFHLHSGKEKILTHVIPQMSGKVVFDIGCGDGYFTKLYAEVAKQVVACDIYSDALYFAKSFNDKTNIDYRLIESGQLPDGEPDCIIFNDSLELNSGWQILFENAYGQLKSGGCIFVTCPNFAPKRTIYFRLLQVISKVLSISKRRFEKKIIQVIETMERPFQFKGLYQRNFVGAFESFLQEKKIRYSRERFFIKDDILLSQIFANTEYCNHIFFRIQK